MGDYLKLFEEHVDYETYIEGQDAILPNVSYCEDNNCVHYNPIMPDPYNGHEYVYLGLPSGTLWAKKNIGANIETETGLYFAWGETQGYTLSQIGTDKSFTRQDYKYYLNLLTPFSKYNKTDNLTTLESGDDAAVVNMGGDWRMPTNEL